MLIFQTPLKGHYQVPLMLKALEVSALTALLDFSKIWKCHLGFTSLHQSATHTHTSHLIQVLEGLYTYSDDLIIVVDPWFKPRMFILITFRHSEELALLSS